MAGQTVALQGDQTDPKFGPPGTVTSISTSVMIDGRPVATVGSPVSVHGNPYNPKRPGFNPPCASATVLTGINNILVEGKPIATLGSLCSCGLHFVQLAGAPSIQVGG